jgi:hypothetical protein
MFVFATPANWVSWPLLGVLLGVLLGGAGSLLYLLFQRNQSGDKPRPPRGIRRVPESPLPVATRERRTSLRRKGQPIVVQIRDAEAAAEVGRGQIVDRSLGGVCLGVDDPIDEGTMLTIRPARAPDSVGWLPVVVKSCREKAGSWELGCEFLQQPSWHILMHFG